MINFDSLPGGKPGFSVIPKGKYLATITKAEMRTPKSNPQAKMYLSLTYAIKDESGKGFGNIFDMISESESDYIRYKLKRFIEALKLPITQTFELKDLTKIVSNKSFWVDLMVDEKSDPPKTVVDIFSGEIFYPLEQNSPQQEPINAPDAADAAPELPDVVSTPGSTEY